MTRTVTVTLTLGMLVLGTTLSQADEPGAKKPLGTWERQVGDAKVQFHFKATTFRCVIMAGDTNIDVGGDYGLTKEGLLFGVISKVDKKGGADHPSEGDLFSFRVSMDKEELVIKDLKGSDSEEAKNMIQGEYKKTAGTKEGK